MEVQVQILTYMRPLRTGAHNGVHLTTLLGYHITSLQSI